MRQDMQYQLAFAILQAKLYGRCQAPWRKERKSADRPAATPRASTEFPRTSAFRAPPHIPLTPVMRARTAGRQVIRVQLTEQGKRDIPPRLSSSPVRHFHEPEHP
ncbi:hypothetical protein HOK021_31320 [Streptomyces hygroscopicus]|nr:hypothetical protein HOK021_31320 [Streptomyces hygroscopicus]